MFVGVREWPGIVLGLLGYGSLFLVTVRQNKRNRPLVLGVLTVALFLSFLLIAVLSQKNASFWPVYFLTTFVIAMGICILLFVVQDVIRWARRE
jgi:peptidoglycan/LPS O-acetylase OafA/YrhL